MLMMPDPVLVLLNTVEAAEYAEDAANAAEHPDQAEGHYQRGVAAFESVPDAIPTTARGAILLLAHALKQGAIRQPTLDLATACANGLDAADPAMVSASVAAIAQVAEWHGRGEVVRCMQTFAAWAADTQPFVCKASP